MQKIEITITPTGDVKLKTTGFAGSTCKTETAEFERQLGKVTSDQLTGEAYRHANDQSVRKG